MLTGMRLNQVNVCPEIKPDDRYSRSIKDDMKIAMELLFQFKEGIEKLHPECSYLIEKLLQVNINRF